jgi:hypothetical protein
MGSSLRENGYPQSPFGEKATIYQFEKGRRVSLRLPFDLLIKESAKIPPSPL